MSSLEASITLARLLQGFFTDRMAHQRQASQHTIAAYRDTVRLLLIFAADRTGKEPSSLGVPDLDAALIGAFLAHLENERGNSTATCNTRLTAIHSFYRYAMIHAPEHAEIISQVLAIPPRRRERAIVCYLSPIEIEALLAAPDQGTWFGRRDHALLLVAVQTGLRVSELISLKRRDLALGAGACLYCHGKGRKDRATPLTRQSAAVLTEWLKQIDPNPDTPLFPARGGAPMSADAVQRLVAKHATTAGTSCASLAQKNVTPHTLRHSAAMSLLRAGVDTSVIALWLGHEDPATTQIYLHADMSIKEEALARIQTPNSTVPGRYQPPDQLLEFLENL